MVSEHKACAAVAALEAGQRQTSPRLGPTDKPGCVTALVISRPDIAAGGEVAAWTSEIDDLDPIGLICEHAGLIAINDHLPKLGLGGEVETP